MGSKLSYAQKAAADDIPSYIVNGKKENIIIDILEGKNVGTEVSKPE
jgi:glutamate 5-kinase